MKAGSIVILTLLALILWGYVVGPMVYTVRQSIGGDYSQFFKSGTGAQEALLGSLWISILSVLTAGITGIFLAILLNRWDFPLRRICQVLVLVPIALPPLMGVESFVLLYGVGGIVPRLLAGLFHSDPNAFALKQMAGVLVVHTVTMYPYFYLSVSALLSQTDDSLEEAAYSLGASRFQTWTRILLPMLTPAVVAGALLTFMSSMSSYTAPLLFDVDKVMTRQIVIARGYGDLRYASAVAVMLAVVSVVFLILIRAYEERRMYRTQSKGGVRRRQRVTSPLAKAVVCVTAVAAAIFMMLPVVIIFILAFSVNGYWRTSLLPTRYTTEYLTRLFSDPASWDAIKNSLVMSAIAVVGVILLGVTCAYVVARMRFRGKALIDIAMMLPWALPGTVVAFNLILAFSEPSVFSFGRKLTFTYAIIPLAYFIRFSPLAFRSTTASLAQLDPSLEEAGRSLGGSWWYTFRKVSLPLLSRGIAAGALLAFVNGVGEFVATILLYPPRYRTLSIAINDELYNANLGTAASLGVVQVVLILAVVIINRRLEDRGVRGLNHPNSRIRTQI